MFFCEDVKSLDRFTKVHLGAIVKCAICGKGHKVERKTYYWSCSCCNVRVYRTCDNDHVIDGDTFILLS